MKKITVLLLLAVAALSSLQLSAKEGADIAPATRSGSWTYKPGPYKSLGSDNHMYYDIDYRRLAGPEYQYAVSLLGEINGRYFSSTYGSSDYDTGGYGAGFLAALKVDDHAAEYVNSYGVNGDNIFNSGNGEYGVTLKTSVEGQGEVAARIIYTVTNNNQVPVTVRVGVYADIMIGNDDEANLKCMKHNEDVYGLRLKGKEQGSIFNPITPIMSVLFGEGVTGVTPADEYWFGFFSSNWHPEEMVANPKYTNTIYNTGTQTYQQSEYEVYYGVEDGGYDSGMGFCWKDKEIPAGESIELSYLVAVGEVEFEEPIPDPEDPEGQDIFTYNVEVENIGDETIDGPWNDLTVAHPARIWGHYEHPYGQVGYIEYRVDGASRAWTGEWTRIETPLISGAEEGYNLPFDMFFNPDEEMLHTHELRFTDGLGNYTMLDGLEWEDIRTISLTVDPVQQAYDGTPKIFVVTVGGVDEYTLGADGAYTLPGNYSQSIWGQYDTNTIGINTVEYTVTKGQAEVDVAYVTPVEYDGNAHGATVNVTTGDAQAVVTYVNTADGSILTTAPVEIGSYIIMVNVPETQFYYGIVDAPYGPIVIYGDPTGINEVAVDKQDGVWYTIDGRRVVAPTEPGLYIHNGKKYIVK